ncbi:MAG: hypothetical protein SGARI_003478 [Bacillariaceae sp.]
MEKFVSEELLNETWTSDLANTNWTSAAAATEGAYNLTAWNITTGEPVNITKIVGNYSGVENVTLQWVENIMQAAFDNLTLPEVPELSEDPTIEEVLDSLHDYLELCEDTALVMMEYLFALVQQIAQEDLGLGDGSSVATESLSFNWIRCWNNTELGNPNPWSPTEEQIEASAYQDAFFQEQWKANQQMKADQYAEDRGCFELSPNSTVRDGCILEAVRDSCVVLVHRHDDGRLWQSKPRDDVSAKKLRNRAIVDKEPNVHLLTKLPPLSFQRSGGRLLVAFLGWLSIIAFAGIIIISTANWMAIADDFFFRLKMPYLKKPLWSSILWGILSIAWIALLASKARGFWRERIPGYEVTKADSYWFAYISSLTVGLGDFYLQPEGMFVADVFSWSSAMLTGFVLVSTFLGKVGDLISSWLPEETESFGEYLKRTDLWSGKVIEPPQSNEINTLRELAVEEQGVKDGTIKVKGEDLYTSTALAPDGKTFNEHKIEILKEKQDLLNKMLEDTQVEIEERIAQSEDAKLSKEEAAV